MRQFAEQEIYLPTGPHAGRRLRLERNPFAGLLLDAWDSNRWRRRFVLGVQQSGKTLLGSNVPLMYHLFERKETVVYGVPSLDMVKDKWDQDIVPVIAASAYRDLLPKKGPGSRGGRAISVTFGNGITLRFMTAGGRDKTRAGFTSRVLVVTEVDGFDEVGARSREADKFSQLEGRVRAWASDALVYGECTVSTEEGRIWREYQGGTQSRIAIRCPHCRKPVTPEREHLVGWKAAPDVLAAAELAHFCCPDCGATWSEADRTAANAAGILLHKGQTIDAAGRIEGESPRTDTLGFRWTAANNLLVRASDVGQEEWRAQNEPDEEIAEKRLRQFVWALPHEPDTVDLTALDPQVIVKRVTTDPQGRVPSDCHGLTVGIDIGKRLCNWTCLGWRDLGTPHVVDYDRLQVLSDEMAVERALLVALREWRDSTIEEGWEGDDGIVVPELVLIDAGWAGQESEHLDEVIYAFCRESNKLAGCPRNEPRYLPAKGWGAGTYKHPRQKDKRVAEIGDEWYVARLPKQQGLRLLHANADHWKSRTHSRLATPLGQPGAMTLFNAPPRDHLSFAKQLTAERQQEEFKPGRGRIIRWHMVSRFNHWLDSTMLATVGGHKAGSRLIAAPDPPERPPRKVVRAAQTNNRANDQAEGEAEAATQPADTAAQGGQDKESGWFASRRRR